ncbi:MAG: hypothetical protein WAM09_14935 [Anaerolineales bacterium]|jgi:hypothetical protein
MYVGAALTIYEYEVAVFQDGILASSGGFEEAQAVESAVQRVAGGPEGQLRSQYNQAIGAGVEAAGEAVWEDAGYTG